MEVEVEVEAAMRNLGQKKLKETLGRHLLGLSGSWDHHLTQAPVISEIFILIFFFISLTQDHIISKIFISASLSLYLPNPAVD